MTLWLALDLENPHNIQIMGVFSTEEKAVAVCTRPTEIIGPIVLDEYVKEERDWPEAYFPIGEVDEYPET